MKYLFDSHVHTSESSICGKWSAKEIVERYKSLNYSGICITDHMNARTYIRYGGDYEYQQNKWFEGFYEAQNYETADFKVIQGMEFRPLNSDNDYLVYGFTKDFVLDNRLIDLEDISDFMKLAKEYNLIVIQAHPFRDDMLILEPGIVDGIEVYNGGFNHDNRNEIAYYWAQKYGYRMLSGSDFHGNIKGEPGGIYLNKIPNDTIEFAEIIRNNDYELAKFIK